METKKIIFGVLLFVITMSVLGYFMRYDLLEGTPWELDRPGQEEIVAPPVNSGEGEVLKQEIVADPVLDSVGDDAAEIAPAEGVVEGEVEVE